MYSYFSGFANIDVAFNHIESKSLIVADLIFNLPAREQYSKSKGSIVQGIFGGFGSLNPYSWGHKKFVTTLGKDKEYVNWLASDVAAKELASAKEELSCGTTSVSVFVARKRVPILYSCSSSLFLDGCIQSTLHSIRF